MATPPPTKEDEQQQQQQAANPSTAAAAAGGGGLSGMVVERYRKTREHAEAYPYVWGSYIVVYGGLGLWFAYRFRKLRKTEDRVRVLQERLRKLVENEKPPPTSSSPASSVAAADKTPPSSSSASVAAVDKSPK